MGARQYRKSPERHNSWSGRKVYQSTRQCSNEKGSSSDRWNHDRFEGESNSPASSIFIRGLTKDVSERRLRALCEVSTDVEVCYLRVDRAPLTTAVVGFTRRDAAQTVTDKINGTTFMGSRLKVMIYEREIFSKDLVRQKLQKEAEEEAEMLSELELMRSGRQSLRHVETAKRLARKLQSGSGDGDSNTMASQAPKQSVFDRVVVSEPEEGCLLFEEKDEFDVDIITSDDLDFQTSVLAESLSSALSSGPHGILRALDPPIQKLVTSLSLTFAGSIQLSEPITLPDEPIASSPKSTNHHPMDQRKRGAQAIASPTKSLGLKGQPVKIRDVTLLKTTMLVAKMLKDLSQQMYACQKSREVKFAAIDHYEQLRKIVTFPIHTLTLSNDEHEILQAQCGNKRSKKERVRAFEAKGKRSISDYLPKSDSYDRTAHRWVRNFLGALNVLFELLVQRIVHFVDDWDEQVRCKAMETLIHVWDTSNCCRPQGYGTNYNVSLQPLLVSETLRRGFIRLKPPDSLEKPDAQPSVWLPEQESTSNPTFISLAYAERLRAGQKSKLNGQPKEDDNVSFCTDTDSPFDLLKSLVRCVESIDSLSADEGWLIRAMESPSSRLKKLACDFAGNSFKQDKSSLEATTKFEMPTQNLLWDPSPAVQDSACEALVWLSNSHAFKSGAFKKFSTLLVSARQSSRKVGIRAMGCFKALNLQAIIQIFKSLINIAANPYMSEGLRLSDQLELAAQVITTNVEDRENDILRALDDIYNKEIQGIIEEESACFLVYSALALRFLCLRPARYLQTIPSSILKSLPLMQSRLRDVFSLELLIFLPSPRKALCLRIPAKDMLRAFAFRSFEEEGKMMALQAQQLKKSLVAGSIQIISALQEGENPEIAIDLRLSQSEGQILCVVLASESMPIDSQKEKRDPKIQVITDVRELRARTNNLNGGYNLTLALAQKISPQRCAISFRHSDDVMTCQESESTMKMTDKQLEVINTGTTPFIGMLRLKKQSKYLPAVGSFMLKIMR